MRLATEDVRNFQCNASGNNGFTCIAWAVYYIFITRFSHDPQSKSGIRCHASFIIIAQSGTGESKKILYNETYMENLFVWGINSNVSC